MVFQVDNVQLLQVMVHCLRLLGVQIVGFAVFIDDRPGNVAKTETYLPTVREFQEREIVEFKSWQKFRSVCDAIREGKTFPKALLNDLLLDSALL